MGKYGELSRNDEIVIFSFHFPCWNSDAILLVDLHQLSINEHY